MNEREWQLEKAKVLRQLEQLTIFDAVESKEERRARLESRFFDWCRTYLPHYFKVPQEAELHHDLVRMLQVREKPGVFAAPRGAAKSTHLIAFILWAILTQREHFIVYAMETLEKAEVQTGKVLIELQFNQRIIHDYGSLVSPEAGRGDFITTTATRLLALGAGMSARGISFQQYRPGLFICDDLENRKLARNPRRVEALLDVVLSDYLNSTAHHGWTFVVVGTVICQGSMLDKLLHHKAFNRKLWSALIYDEDGTARSYWPEMIPLEKLELMRETLGASRFAAEQQNKPVAIDGVIKETWFRHWSKLPAFDPHKIVMQVDPSFSIGGDNKAIGVGVKYQHDPAKSGKWLDSTGQEFIAGSYRILIELFNRKCSMDEMIRQLYRLNDAYKPRRIVIDGTYAQKTIWEREIARYEARHGSLPIKFRRQREKKEDKIVGLESSIERGFLVFPPRNTDDVEQTIQQFTRLGETGMPDDGPDMIAELVKSLDDDDRTMSVHF